MGRFILFLVVSALLAACPAPLPPEPPIVIVYPDAGADRCDRACSKLRDLACPEGAPSPGGATCEEVCRNAGPAVRADCVVVATSREDLARCSVRCIP